jgi:LysR family cys regulon transcriptional activator
LRGYMYDFIELFAPHLTREVVESAFSKSSRAELEDLFNEIDLPIK